MATLRSGSAAALALALAAIGCGGGADSGTTAGADPGEPAPARPSAAAPSRGSGAAEAEPATPARCPPGVAGCRSATGRIVYVERLDPDGDGDAHFVIVDPQGITMLGLTAIDVRRGLRPHPLPGPGELISAAGPVQTGSYGQRQIHAVTVRVPPRGAPR